MWRGMMLNRAVQHFLEDVQWGDLDYLLIDMPPGTSDIQMGLARMLPRTDVVIVTTPANAAQQVAARAADMARKGFLRVAGVIENMGPSTAPDGTVTAMFGSGGGQHLADSIGVPLLGSIPLDAAVAAGGDSGLPVALDEPDSPASGRVPGPGRCDRQRCRPACRDRRVQPARRAHPCRCRHRRRPSTPSCADQPRATRPGSSTEFNAG